MKAKLIYQETFPFLSDDSRFPVCGWGESASNASAASSSSRARTFDWLGANAVSLRIITEWRFWKPDLSSRVELSRPPGRAATAAAVTATRPKTITRWRFFDPSFSPVGGLSPPARDKLPRSLQYPQLRKTDPVICWLSGGFSPRPSEWSCSWRINAAASRGCMRVSEANRWPQT